jgi:phospholipase/carboxylesterase
MTGRSASAPGPHQGQPILTAGEAVERATGALILIHGRGATAQSIISLSDSDELAQPGLAYLAPQAAGNTWYPYSFLSPIPDNEPYLSSALAAIQDLLDGLSQAGIVPERTMLLGFSQGACLALEFVARHARRYGGVVGLSGGLIGPDDTPREYGGALAGTPVFLGCSDIDPHIPKERVLYSAEVLQGLGGDVTTRLYPHMGHTINQDELGFVQGLVAVVAR